MKKVAILTDNSSGFSPEEAEKLGLKIIYIPFIIDGEEYIENSNLTREQFFNLLNSNANISTSQPSQLVIKECWDELLKTHDEVVYIPLSSGLSATCKMSQQSALEYNGKVEVVDNKRVSVTLKAC
ncbi:MAG: DegV family protein, partial [Clostridia bacterium]|nr:DegV family protein [Clostridia bacterium]